MNKVLYAIVSVMALASCANSFQITGTTNVSTLDGQKLYLSVQDKNIDSCDVIHGQFQFAGATDSVRVGNIVLDDNNTVPVVLEGGDIQVKIDNTQMNVTGTPLNDKFNKFRTKFTQLQNQSEDLIHQQNQAIMNGQDMNVVNRRLAAKSQEISARMDDLVTNFVEDNFDNVLGPFVFLNVCTFKYNDVPMLDAWVEDIWSKATDNFKNNPKVKEYYQIAQENQNIMNGTKDVQAPQPQGPAPGSPAPPQKAPTPKELAQ